MFSVGVMEESGEGIGAELRRKAALLELEICLAGAEDADLILLSPRTAVKRAEGRYVVLPGGAQIKVRADCAVTYGFSPRDTVTLSSVSDEAIVISLQREILTLSSVVAERQEIPVAVTDALDTAGILAVAAALVALGATPAKLASIS